MINTVTSRQSFVCFHSPSSLTTQDTQLCNWVLVVAQDFPAGAGTQLCKLSFCKAILWQVVSPLCKLDIYRTRKRFSTCSCAFTRLFTFLRQLHHAPCSLLAHRKQYHTSITLQAISNFAPLVGSLNCQPHVGRQHLDSQFLTGDHQIKISTFHLAFSPKAKLFSPKKGMNTSTLILLGWLGWQLHSLLWTFINKSGLHTSREKSNLFSKKKSDLISTSISYTSSWIHNMIF